MNIALTIVLILLILAELCACLVEPIWPHGSGFELKRKANLGDKRAAKQLRRRELYYPAVTLRHLILSILIVLIVTISSMVYKPLTALIIGLSTLFLSWLVCKISFLQKIVKAKYLSNEDLWLTWADKLKFLTHTKGSSPDVDSEAAKIASKAELEHLITNAKHILSDNERLRVMKALQFDNLIISDIMTPRDLIDEIDKDDLMGPLTLDSLHKTGHSSFPVVDGDLDHVVGVILATSLFVVNGGSTLRASDVMQSGASFIMQEKSLAQALAMLLKDHQQILIVTDKDKKTVGIISLSDCIEALTGKNVIK